MNLKEIFRPTKQKIVFFILTIIGVLLLFYAWLILGLMGMSGDSHLPGVVNAFLLLFFLIISLIGFVFFPPLGLIINLGSARPVTIALVLFLVLGYYYFLSALLYLLYRKSKNKKGA
ncbi:MAG: hypothetical protein ABIB61_04370 [Candidatus Shapirobacteria bacterium]